MEKTYSAACIRPEEHRSTLARLWKENLSSVPVTDDVAEQRMRWFQEANPAGPARTWMGFHGPDKEVIGSGSFFPRDVHVDGRTLKVGVLGDFAVTRAHRIAGAAMSIQREIAREYRETGIDFLYAFPNKASFPIFQRAGYKKIAGAQIWVRPLAAGYKLHELAAAPREEQRAAAFAVLQRVAERAGAALPSPRWRALWSSGEDGAPAPASRALASLAEGVLARLASAPDSAPVKAAAGAVDAAMALRDEALHLAKGRGVEGEIVDAADSRFDDLWARAKRTFILGERTSRYLNWRYSQVGVTQRRYFCLLDRSDRRLLGYAVYAVRNNKVEVIDVFCEDFDAHLDLLFLELCRAMRREGRAAVGLIFVGPRRLGERLRALGFFERSATATARWFIVNLDARIPEALQRSLLDVNSWFMTDGELDA